MRTEIRDQLGIEFPIFAFSHCRDVVAAVSRAGGIESELLSHEDVIDAAVVGVPDPRSGEAVLAYMVPATGAQLDEDELRSYLSGRLATYKIPEHIVGVDELPRAGRGKLDRKALQDQGALR